MRPLPSIPSIALAALLALSSAMAMGNGTEQNEGISTSATAPAGELPPPEAAPDCKDKLIGLLPPAVSDGLDIDGWLWLEYLHTDQREKRSIYDAELSLDFTKSFGQRAAVTFEGNFIDADGDTRVELEQGFISVVASPTYQTLVTVGKFNAGFGVEARDFWNRTTGTTSLLFGAQPQDLIGFMVTQPIGETGLKVRPFVSADFQGVFNFDQTPAAGMNIAYQVDKQLRFSATAWVGPGIILDDGHHLQSPYERGGYGAGGTSIFANWQGPNLFAQRGGTLCFFDANVVWRPREDLTLSAEYLFGNTDTSSDGPYGWSGVMGLANFDLTDHWALFARYSYLNDSDWLATGVFQIAQEVSGGVSYRITNMAELRGEYRHDSSSVGGSIDSFSFHLTVGF